LFGFQESQNNEDKEDKRRQESHAWFEKQKREQTIRDQVTAELNRLGLEEIGLKIYKLYGLLSVADPLDRQYARPNLEKAASIRKEIDEVIGTNGQELAEYLKLKREKYAALGVLNPGSVDSQVASALFLKGLMEEWRWESDPEDRFWEKK